MDEYIFWGRSISLCLLKCQCGTLWMNTLFADGYLFFKVDEYIYFVWVSISIFVIELSREKSVDSYCWLVYLILTENWMRKAVVDNIFFVDVYIFLIEISMRKICGEEYLFLWMGIFFSVKSQWGNTWWVYIFVDA